MILKKQVGKKLKDIRNENKLSQQQVADSAKIEQRHISGIEQGKGNITINTLERIAEVLNKNVIIDFKEK